MNKHNVTFCFDVLAIDLAKNIFHTCAINQHGRVIERKQLSRSQLKRYLAQASTRIVAMEACGSAHYWARFCEQLNLQVRMISPQFVKPYLKSNKNDRNDAEAIAEAATRPTMRFVSVKNVDQQTLLAIHRARQLAVSRRTAQINQIRGMLLEFGIPIAQGPAALKRHLPHILEDAENELPSIMRELIATLWQELIAMDEQVKHFEQLLQQLAKTNEDCKRLTTIPGIGPMTATALLATIGSPTRFKSGRQMAAYLGLVPRQHSTGGKDRLLGISKRGDSYLRQLLIHGGRAVVRVLANRRQDKLTQWLTSLKERRGYNKTAVALANKNIRIAWKMLTSQTNYKAPDLVV